MCENLSTSRKNTGATTISVKPAKNDHQKGVPICSRNPSTSSKANVVKRTRAVSVSVAMANLRPMPVHATSKKNKQRN